MTLGTQYGQTVSDSTKKEVTPSMFDFTIQTIALVLESNQKMDVEDLHGQLTS